MAPKQRPDSNAKASPGKKELPNPDEYVNCMCFEVYLKRCDGTWVTKSDGTYETKRFMAPRDIEFPDLCEKLAATFPGDLRIRHKERSGKVIKPFKPNFEVAYRAQGCHHCDGNLTPSTLKSKLVLFDTLGLRAMLNAFESRSGWDDNSPHRPSNVHKIVCTVRDGMCTIL